MNRLDEKTIFKVANSIDSPEMREDYLQHVCGDNPLLRDRVLNLLRVQVEEPDFLEASPVGSLGTVDIPPITEHAGSVISRYKLMEEIGDGGMGVVYVAEQTQPVRRKVALKIIKPGMDSKQVIARFEAERQALALMVHPNIAQVHDGGTTESGRPYFVMELVRGIPITKFCDQYQYSTRQRLELFTDVCQAIQHAHQKGIIHRDVKPSNVLVTLYDDKPVVKVIDFGVAKAVNQELVQQTVYSNFAQLIGTPLYMSPEQAEMNALDVDTRSDIYSLGVLLYELLSGATPFDSDVVNQAGFDEMRRIIREIDPPRPSQRLTTLEGQALSTVSERRGVDERQLGRILSGDLDWIVMKALEKDRTRRYDTASALAADIEHFLNDEPVLACPPSSGYRLAKFVRRNKAMMVTGSLIVASLIVGIAGTAWQASRVKDEQRRTAVALGTARQKAKESEAVVEFLIEDMLASARPDRALGRKITVEEVLANAETKIAEAFGDQPLVEAEVRLRLGQTHSALGHNETARVHFERARSIREKILGPAHEETITVAFNLADEYRELGQYDDALHLAEDIQDTLLRINDPNDWVRPLWCMQLLGICHADLGNEEEAEELQRKVVAEYRRRLGSDHCITLTAIQNLSNVVDEPESFELRQEAYEVLQRVEGPEHPLTLSAMKALATSFRQRGQYDKARALYEQLIDSRQRILGTEHHQTANAMNGLANVFIHQGQFSEAKKLVEEALRITRKAFGPEHPDTLRLMRRLALVNSRLGNYAEAEKLRRFDLQVKRDRFGEEHEKTFDAMNELAWTLVHREKFQEARQLAEKALEGQSRQHSPDHNDTLALDTQDTLAASLEGLGLWQQARQLREEIIRQSLEDHRSMPDFLHGMVMNISLVSNAPPSDRRRAIDLAEQAIELDKRDGESWRVAGVAYATSGKWQKAIEAFRRAVDLGFDGQLVPQSILDRIKQSSTESAEAQQELLEFVRENKIPLAKASGRAGDRRR